MRGSLTPRIKRTAKKTVQKKQTIIGSKIIKE